MKQAVRWWVAGLVTVVAFAAPTWICGAIILPTVIKNPGIRWSIAAALGLAVAALAALWGHSFATAEQVTGPGTGSGDVHNEISGGIQNGPVIQSRDITGPIFPTTTPPRPDSDSKD